MNGDIEGFDGQGIFGAAVHITLLGANGVGGDGHTFDDGMGVAFQHAAVHEGTRVAFVGVADDVFHFAGVLAGELPFFGSGETRAAASAQAGSKDFINHTVGGHFGDDFGQGHVTVFGDVIFDVEGINFAAVGKHHAHFFGLGSAKLFIHSDAFDRLEFFDDTAFEEMLFHQEGDVIGIEIDVVNPFGVDHQIGAFGRRVAEARGFQNLDFIDQALIDQFVVQRVNDIMRTFGKALRVHGYQYMRSIKSHRSTFSL